MSANPPAFSEDELATFLSFVGLPESLLKQRYTGDAAEDLHLLRQFHTHWISTIPYENLSLHYNPNHAITIQPRDTYKKIVSNGRGRVGYCMEVIIFCNHILRGLGFPAYLSAVRNRHRVDGIPQGEFSGWHGSAKCADMLQRS